MLRRFSNFRIALRSSHYEVADTIEETYQQAVKPDDESQSRRYKVQQRWHTIERNHFRDQGEANLLTWAAKEQIKFLNAKSPETWTPSVIAQHFPVSEKGALKILKSKWAPKSTQQLRDHDDRVAQNWQELRKRKPCKGGPIEPKHRSQTESRNSLVVKTDINNLPQGVFSSMVAHLPKKTVANVEDSRHEPFERTSDFDGYNPVVVKNKQREKGGDFGFEELPKSRREKTYLNFSFKYQNL